jgi:hypothetical protein
LAQVALGVAGGVVGFFVGGPAGAAIGFSAGMALGALANSPKPPRQSLGEIAKQTAKESDPRIIVWGRVRPIGGNLIHCQKPIKRWVSAGSGGGKGGGGSEQKVEHVYRTYAIGVCEGPITGFLRIWRNSKLVYDARGTSWGEKNNPVFLKNFRLHLGGWDQIPSSRLEAIWGVGNVPAYRGTAYMVAINEDLTDLGGSVPQWLFEVERAEGIFLTSRPYAIEDLEAIQGGVPSLFSPPVIPPEAIDAQSYLISGELKVVFIPYNNWPPEALDASAEINGGELRTLLILYDNGEPEALDTTAIVISGSLEITLIQYNNWPAEALDASAIIQSGTLS